jgi:hypothetical protein
MGRSHTTDRTGVVQEDFMYGVLFQPTLHCSLNLYFVPFLGDGWPAGQKSTS